MTPAERQAALDAIAGEVAVCTRCRLHEGRTRAVPGEGSAATEVVFVGEGPGYNEDQEGRPFVGRAGGLLVRLLASIGWRRDDVFITNVVKCRPPGNRDPEPDEITACSPFLRRQLEAIDPALVVTLGRYSMATFMPGVRISQAHGTTRPVDPSTGARDALAFAMYHPAAALRTSAIERDSYDDIARVPTVLLESRRRRAAVGTQAATAAASENAVPAPAVPAAPLHASAAAAPAGLSAPRVEQPAAPGPTVAVLPPADEPPADQLTLF